eukprot:3728342-Rhodomonas_salina.1
MAAIFSTAELSHILLLHSNTPLARPDKCKTLLDHMRSKTVHAPPPHSLFLVLVLVGDGSLGGGGTWGRVWSRAWVSYFMLLWAHVGTTLLYRSMGLLLSVVGYACVAAVEGEHVSVDGEH